MRIDIINQNILSYLKHLNSSEWIIDEAYKFEFANYLKNNVKFESQTNEEILEILRKSQTISYDRSRGIQFIQKSGRETLKTFVELKDIELFRNFGNSTFQNIEWTERTMSFTALSAWLSSLFPEKFYPIPKMGFNDTINYLFQTNLDSFPKIGENYILACQEFMKETEKELKKYPIQEIHLKVWNEFYKNNPELNIKPKNEFEKIDWNWLTQDFHLFLHRKVLDLYKSKEKNTISEIVENFEPFSIEGEGKLAVHMRYERNSHLIKKIKKNAIKSNPMLNCEVCEFSFYEKYGKLGEGFIEAHHKKPLSETQKTKTTKDDIALLCSNCHKMIHKGVSENDNNSIMTIKELKDLINKENTVANTV